MISRVEFDVKEDFSLNNVFNIIEKLKNEIPEIIIKDIQKISDSYKFIFNNMDIYYSDISIEITVYNDNSLELLNKIASIMKSLL